MALSGFSAFDNLAGGLRDHSSNFLYGGTGSGKTTFALTFLNQGLSQGETVALVASRPPETVFAQARSMGFDLEPHLSRRRLLVFEYPLDVLENAVSLQDATDIIAEFNLHLTGHRIQRLVIDPVTPLLASPTISSSIFRMRAILQAFAELRATSLYLADLPEGEAYVGGCKGFFEGVARFESEPNHPGRGRIVVERGLNAGGTGNTMHFEIRPGVGLVETTAHAAVITSVAYEPQLAELTASAEAQPDPTWNVNALVPDRSHPQKLLASSEAGKSQFRVLVVDPRREKRDIFKPLLQQNYTILEAEGVAQALAVVASESPDLLILQMDMPGVSGADFAKKLRQNKVTTPIIIVGDQLMRARDKVRVMAAGVDLILEEPLDGRLLKQSVNNLIQRTSAQGWFGNSTLDNTVISELDRSKVACTNRADVFLDRIRQEEAYSQKNGVNFVIVALRIPRGEDLRQQLSAVAAYVARPYDLVFVGEEGVIVLLAETHNSSPFLERFKGRWTSAVEPEIDQIIYDRRADFHQAVKRFANLEDRSSTSGEPAQASYEPAEKISTAPQVVSSMGGSARG